MEIKKSFIESTKIILFTIKPFCKYKDFQLNIVSILSLKLFSIISINYIVIKIEKI